MFGFWARIRAALQGRERLNAELREEIDCHFEMEVEKHISEGAAPNEARMRAARSFGNKTLVQENAHEAWLFWIAENFIRDLIYACRGTRRSPAFSVAAISILALGIGGTTAVFTLIRGVLFRPLDYPEPDRLVQVSIDNTRQKIKGAGFSEVRYSELKSAHSFDLAAFFIASEHMGRSGSGEPEQLTIARISANSLEILGVQPILGRNFQPDEDKSGGTPVVLISAELWKRRFGRGRDIVGQTVTLDAGVYTIVGVLPPNFAFPKPGIDAWVPRPSEMSAIPPQLWRRITVLVGLARLKHGVTIQQAQSEADVINRRYDSVHPDEVAPGSRLVVETLADQMVGNVRQMLWILFGAVAVVLLIACANIASLLLARAATRSREFALRAALGAERSRLIRQLIAEGLALYLAGGSLGVLIAYCSVNAARQSNIVNLPRLQEIRLDTTVLVFAFALSIFTSLLFCLLPSVNASRTDLAFALRERQEAGGQAAALRGGRVTSWLEVSARAILTVAQVSLSVVLLTGAVLLLRSFVELHRVDPGFRPDGLLTMRIDLPPKRYNTPEKKEMFFRSLVEHVNTIPGVHGSAAALTLPTAPRYSTPVQVVEQASPNLSERPQAQLQSVTPDYFRTAGLVLRRGRYFTDRDNAPGARLVSIVNESCARRLWSANMAAAEPIGRHIFIGSNTSPASEVVGIVSDVHESGLVKDASPEVYLPDHFYPLQSAGLVVRTEGDPMQFVNSVRQQVLAIDPAQAISNVKTMKDVLESSVGQQRLMLVLIGSFAAVALLLAVIGIYGLIAYSVSQRTSELAIRQALGARPLDILGLVAGQGLTLTLLGVALGSAAGLALTRLIGSMLFQVSPTDPISFVAVSLLFLSVGGIASYFPARRAIRINPLDALR
jgi:predicted permease